MKLFILAAPLIDTESVYQFLGTDAAYRPSDEAELVHHAMSKILGKDLLYHKMLESLSISIFFCFDNTEERRAVQSKLHSWANGVSHNHIVSCTTLDKWCSIARDLCAPHQSVETRTLGNALANTLFLSGAGELIKSVLKPHGHTDEPYFL